MSSEQRIKTDEGRNSDRRMGGGMVGQEASPRR